MRADISGIHNFKYLFSALLQKKSRSLQLSALQQSVQDSETYNEQDELQQSSDKNNFNYKNVLPFFNVQQIVKPTTYKPQLLQQRTFIYPQKQTPPSSHRFNQKQKNGYLPLNNNDQERRSSKPEENVQIIPSIALIPEASSDSIFQTPFDLIPPPEQQFILEQKNQEQLVLINHKEGGHTVQRHFPVEQSHNFATHRQQEERFANNNNHQESLFPLPQNGFTISHSVIAEQSQIDEQSAQAQPFQQEPTDVLVVPQFINNGFYSSDFSGSVPLQKTQQLQLQPQLQPQPQPKLVPQPQPQHQLQPRVHIDRTFRPDGPNKSFSRILLTSSSGSHDSFVQYK